jgi:glucose-6-phosphate 1-dehydrogenase
MNDEATILTGITSAAPEGERRTLPLPYIDDPVTIVIFGATGDLTLRKLVPALYALFSQGMFRKDIAIVGFARRDYSEDVFRDLMSEAIKTFGRIRIDQETLDRFVARTHYHRGNLDNPESFFSLKARLAGKNPLPPNYLFYLAVTPDLFLPTIVNLRSADLIAAPHSEVWSRVVIEKPFGRGLESARNLNAEVRAYLNESQIYRIDHYLGKETVQNILGFRLANSIFEPLFNGHHVDHIQITASETVGMESGRGAYYDAAGAMRDMVQNHMLQLLCLVTMEPPSSLTAEATRNAKVQLLNSLLPPAPNEMHEKVIFGQYGAGKDNGVQIPAYVDEEHVARDSVTESYCAARFTIENWRWAGVPVYLRTGKRLRTQRTEVAIQFKMPPLQLFHTVECVGDVCDLTRSHPNVLVFRIHPNEGITLRFSAKRPALQFVVESVAMDFSYLKTWNISLPEAYERLLMDVMRGDSTLFMRSDEVEAAWRVIDPVLQARAHKPGIPLRYYEPGSWGPVEADKLLSDEGRAWRNVQ